MKTFVKALNHDGAACMLYLKKRFGLFQKRSQTERRSAYWAGNLKTTARCPVYKKNLILQNWMLGNHLNRLSKIFLANMKLKILLKLLKTFFKPTNYWVAKYHLSYISSMLILFFAPNLGAVSDEHGERFHQDITLIESRYKGKSNVV